MPNKAAATDSSDGLDQMRLDVWLWRARFFKTRALAGAAVSRRGARIDRAGLVRRVDKPSVSVAIGDCLSFTRAKRVESVEILALPTRRGPAAEAAECFRALNAD